MVSTTFRKGLGLGATLGAAAIGLAWQLSTTTSAQPAAPNRQKFEFLVIESYDAQYLGDDPGHIGRAGGLGIDPPDIALGDPVYHEQTRVGKVSRLVWNEARQSLQVEFDPEPGQRIYIGDPFWIPIGGPPAQKR